MNTICSSSVGVYTHEHLQHLVLQTYETLKDENVTSTTGSNTQTEEGVAIVVPYQTIAVIYINLTWTNALLKCKKSPVTTVPQSQKSLSLNLNFRSIFWNH